MTAAVHALRTRLLVSLAAVGVALVCVAAASADIVTSTDAQGRPITFDVRATGVDVEWYASYLRNAAHGDEISRVTIRIVPRSEISSYCGSGALACYGNGRSGATMTVPAGNDDNVAHSLMHEYGHHLDGSWAISGVRELNGTPAWWAARGMAQLVADGRVAFDYSLGWDRSVGEIFAEDYAWLYVPSRYGIGWLSPPDATLRAALLAELGGATSTPTTPPPTPQPEPLPPPATPTPPTRPVNVVRSGVLTAGARRSIPFELLGTGRRVTFSAAVSGREPRVTLEIVCNGASVATAQVVTGRTTTLDRSNLGPAKCEAALVSSSTATRRYVVNLRLSLG